MKNQYRGGDCLKRGHGQFVDLRGMLGKKGRVVFLTGRWYPNAHHTLGKTVENTPWEIRLRLSFLYWEDIILQLYINSKFVSDFYYFFEPVQFFFFFLPYSNKKCCFSLFRASTDGNYLYSSISLSLFGDDSMKEGLRILPSCELFLHNNYCCEHPVFLNFLEHPVKSSF